jgi:hypothetical protein
MRGFGADQQTELLQYAPSATQTQPIMRTTTSETPLQPRGTAFLTTVAPPPACLSTAQALAIVQWMTNPVGSPPVPPDVMKLPLCPGEPPLTLPACRDAELDDQIAYCGTYPGGGGPDAGKNATCWLATKDAAWYSALKGLPPCAGDGGASQEGGKKMMIWGGILLAVLVVGGGAYLYARGKKKKR